MEAKERLRERTTLQFYDVYTVSRFLDEPPTSQPGVDGAPHIATPCKDVALTALAQLVALRLDARRCLISLFDAEYQYIVAEATRSLALNHDSKTKHGEGDELWLSNTAIHRRCGICENVLLLPSLQEAPSKHEDGDKPVTPSLALIPEHVTVIPDVAEDARFKDRPFVSVWPHNRFYAGCPIRTSRGVDIGALCVFDTESRPDGLDSAQVDLMIAISGAVMSTLESNRARKESRRNERMVRGIGSFVEGSSTLAGWWENIDTAAFQAQADGEGLLDAAQQDLAKQAQINPLTGRETSNSAGADTSPEPAIRHSSEPNSDLLSGVSQHDHATTVQPLPVHVTPQGAHARAVQTAFAKAANLIRESLEVEGVMFLDGRISTFGGMVERQNRESATSSHSGESSDVAKYLSSTSKSSTKSKKEEDDVLSKVLAFANSDNSTINQSSTGGHYALTESILKTFIRRYPLGTIFNFDKLGALESSDSDGSTATVTSASSTLNETNVPAPHKKKGKRRSKINDASTILKLLPEARSAIFFPLWDFDRQRWFAGSIVWSSRPRSFTARGELSYLSAFGNTIMSQIARLDAIVIDKAKTDLLGSISHELRSPLHGVLGGVEMLADTDIDPFQNDVLHTIETCGKTLLDTMDHLLDFAKINNFSPTAGRIATSKRRKRRGEPVQGANYTIESGMRTLFSDVELDLLVEEVVESVYAGQQFASKREDSPVTSPSEARGLNQLMKIPELAVILDLDYAAQDGSQGVATQVKDWRFNIVPGGMRRILMNIFGNAIKYTDNGSIRIALSCSPAPHQKDEVRQPSAGSTDSRTSIEEVVLRVTDTGRGISSSFLDHQMFLPFTQEDRLNPGTGLGLSIAHQIVGNLNGTIKVRSNVGHGTEFTITLPLPRSQRSRSRDSSDSTATSGARELEDHIRAAKGLRIALVGFSGEIEEAHSSAPRTPAPSLHGRRSSYEAEAAHWTLPRAEIENICRTKLGMEVLTSPQDLAQLSDMVPRPELLLTTECYLERLVADLDSVEGLGKDHVIPPIVVVCPSIATARERARKRKLGRAVVDFISQPCGPRKLADAFALSLLRWSEDREQGSMIETPPSPAGLEEDVTPMQELPKSAMELVKRPRSSHDEVLEPVWNVGPAPVKRDRFLLVEDNQINLRILVSFVKKKRLEYDTAENGLIALEFYREKHASYRFIFMDISMPVMTGLEASREIRSFEREHDLPPVTIVALTALASEGVQQEAFASGIDLFLTKPVRLKELGDIIAKSREGSSDMSSG